MKNAERYTVTMYGVFVWQFSRTSITTSFKYVKSILALNQLVQVPRLLYAIQEVIHVFLLGFSMRSEGTCFCLLTISIIYRISSNKHTGVNFLRDLQDPVSRWFGTPHNMVLRGTKSSGDLVPWGTKSPGSVQRTRWNGTRTIRPYYKSSDYM